MQVRKQQVKFSLPDNKTTERYVAIKIELHCTIKKNVRKRKTFFSGNHCYALQAKIQERCQRRNFSATKRTKCNLKQIMQSN